MDATLETDLRRRSIHLRSLADIRLVHVLEGCGAQGRVLEIRTPTGLSLDIALDRAGDILRLNWRGTELGWHSATAGRTPWPVADVEENLGFHRGFDGFLVTCGLDHHGVATKTAADGFKYPLRTQNHHPLHGRIYAQPCELLGRDIDWEAGAIHVRLRTQQATVFGEVLELNRTYTISLEDPKVSLEDRVVNRSFRPTRHGILYHINVGYPLLDEKSRLLGGNWSLADKLGSGGAGPLDDHVEVVDVEASPEDGVIGVSNSDVGVGLRIEFDPARLPATALWQAFQSGVFALGLEPQTVFSGEETDLLAPGGQEIYDLSWTVESS